MNAHYNDISPNMNAGQALRGALEELKNCQGIFDSWARQLEGKAGRRSHHLEHQLEADVDNLRDVCTTAVESSETIVDGYLQFSKAMVQYLDTFADRDLRSRVDPKDRRLVNDRDHSRQEITALADSLSTHSLLVTELISKIQVYLRDVVSTALAFEEMVTHRKKMKSLWSWLSVGLSAVAALLTVASAFCPLVLPAAVAVIAPMAAAGAIMKAGAYLCGKAEEEYATDRFEEKIDQLLATISRQAKEAESSLAKAETCHEMVRVELALQMGQFDNMTAYEAAELGSMWRTQSYLLENV